MSNARAATMFAMNIQTWKQRSFVQEHYPAETIETLERGLSDMARSEDGRSGIVWGLRQIAFERREASATRG